MPPIVLSSLLHLYDNNLISFQVVNVEYLAIMCSCFIAHHSLCLVISHSLFNVVIKYN